MFIQYYENKLNKQTAEICNKHILHVCPLTFTSYCPLVFER